MLSTQRTIQKVVSKIISRRFRHLRESNNSVFSGNYSKPRMVLFPILKSCLSKQVSNSVDLVDEKILELEQEIKKVIFEIGAVEKKIANIEKKIANVEVNIEIAQSSNNQREVDYWRNEKTQLRGKEDKLRNEEAQLRDKDKELRDKEKELREKESLDIAGMYICLSIHICVGSCKFSPDNYRK